MSSPGPIRFGVIGAGSMGYNHARVVSEMDDVELVGIAEPNPLARERVARRFRVPAYASYADLLATRPDAVSVVVPTSLHYAVAAEAIAAGCHVLVEKPLAASTSEGVRMIAEAAAADVILSVGHVERFNPAVQALKARLEGGALGAVFQVHARRLGPFPSRIRDVGVVIDLATHDLDVMRFLLGAQVTRVYAETARRIHTDHEDLLSGLIRFDNGAIGVLDVNWLTPTKIRELSVTGERGMFVVNYLSQDLIFFQNEAIAHTWVPGNGIAHVSEGDVVKVHIDRQEALSAELRAFVAAVRGDAPPVVTGQDGLEALLLAEAIVRSGLEHRDVPVARPDVGERVAR